MILSLTRAQSAGIAADRGLAAVILRSLVAAVGFWQEGGWKLLADALHQEVVVLQRTGAWRYLCCLAQLVHIFFRLVFLVGCLAVHVAR